MGREEKSHHVRGYLLPGGTLLHHAYQRGLEGRQGCKKKKKKEARVR